ncbi:MAG: hypothetical protein SWH61_01550 [Thermodesulfobacteriota bacterium]|nr:hypothetical protein [Thermodesulfobacteriota bacterium]
MGSPFRLKRTAHIFAGLLIVLLFFQGCAPSARDIFIKQANRQPDNERFLNLLDEAVAEEDVGNASVGTIAGFPYLRVDRFLAGVPPLLSFDDEKSCWARWVLEKGIVTREKEIACLSPDAQKRLASAAGTTPDPASLSRHMNTCAISMFTNDQSREGFFEAVTEAAEVPGEYVTSLRIAGAYPLTSLPVVLLTRKAHKRMRQWHQQQADDIPVHGKLVHYRCVGATILNAGDADAVKKRIAKTADNALSVPRPDSVDVLILARAFAPVLIQDETGPNDRIGRIVWRNGEIAVDTDTPVVYYYLTNAFYRDRPIVQINYAAWYPARKGGESPWIEQGRIDGLTIRISLDSRGVPFMVDMMNNCGCYHFFMPRKGVVKAIKPKRFTIDAFIPRELPAEFPEKRLTVQMNTGWHQVRHIDTSPPANAGEADNGAVPYTLLPYDFLETLPKTGGTCESMFDNKGIVKGSGRIEPLLLFPMGIPKVGSMRQRGNHALKLVGREHFSDPRLFDNNFEYVDD